MADENDPVAALERLMLDTQAKQAGELPPGTPDLRGQNRQALKEGFNRGASLGWGEKAEARFPLAGEIPSLNPIDPVMDALFPPVEPEMDQPSNPFMVGDEEYEQRKDTLMGFNEQLAEQNPVMNTVGEIAGFLLPGAGLIKGAQTVGKGVQKIGNVLAKTDTVVGRTIKAAIGGAAESGAFAAGQDNDPIWGAITGAGFGAGGQAVLGEVAPMIWRTLGGKTGKVRQTEIDAVAMGELRELVQRSFPNAKVSDQYLSELTASMKELGPEATVADLTDVLFQKGLQFTSDAGFVDAGQALSARIAARAEELPQQFRASMQNLLSEELVYTPAAIKQKAAQDFKEYQPIFQETLHASPIQYDTKLVDNALKDAFQIKEIEVSPGVTRDGANSQVSLDTYEKLQSFVDELKDTANTYNSPKGKIRTKAGSTTFMPEDLLALRETVDDLYDESVNPLSPTSNKGKARQLAVLRDGINELLSDIKGFDDINSKYYETRRVVDAHERGLKFMKQTDATPDDARVFFETAPPYQIDAFLNGAKQHFVQLMSKAKGDEKLMRKLAEDSGFTAKLKAISNEPMADAIIDSAVTAHRFAKKDAQFMKARAKGAVREASSTIGSIVEAATATLGLFTPYVSQAAGLGASRRVVNKAQGIASRVDESLGDMMASQPNPQMLQRMSEQGMVAPDGISNSDLLSLFASGAGTTQTQN